MTRSEWTTIAKMLGEQRAAVAAQWPPSDVPANAAALQAFNQRKISYLAQLELCDKIAITLAATLDRLCHNFDRHHFMRIVGGT